MMRTTQARVRNHRRLGDGFCSIGRRSGVTFSREVGMQGRASSEFRHQSEISALVTSASVRVRAAEAIFHHVAKAIEIEDIEARVVALEAAAASGEQRR